MNLPLAIRSVSLRRGITVQSLLAESGISTSTWNDFVQGRLKTEPSLRFCAHLLNLQERCGLVPAPIPFEIDGVRIVVTPAPNPTPAPLLAAA